MSRSLSLLPSANALVVFEAAARLGSFKRAAEELNVTQPSISQTVRAMEDRLGGALFVRGNRGVQLTAAGAELMSAVEPALRRIDGALRSISATGNRTISIASSTSVATQWLLPLTASFQRAHPDLNVRLLATDRNVEPGGDVDFTIRRGPVDWDLPNCWHVSDEVLYTICSRSYLARRGPVSDIRDLANHDIIHNHEAFRNRMNWREWLSAQGFGELQLPETLTLNEYQLVIQACIAGEGIALGWSITTKALVDQGILVRPLDNEVHTGHAFYILGDPETRLSRHKMDYVDWIRSGLTASA